MSGNLVLGRLARWCTVIHLRLCQHCSEWFEAGVGTGRRGDAKFCSKEHQVLFNSRKRSKDWNKLHDDIAACQSATTAIGAMKQLSARAERRKNELAEEEHDWTR